MDGGGGGVKNGMIIKRRIVMGIWKMEAHIRRCFPFSQQSEQTPSLPDCSLAVTESGSTAISFANLSFEKIEEQLTHSKAFIAAMNSFKSLLNFMGVSAPTGVPK